MGQESRSPRRQSHGTISRSSGAWWQADRAAQGRCLGACPPRGFSGTRQSERFSFAPRRWRRVWPGSRCYLCRLIVPRTSRMPSIGLRASGSTASLSSPLHSSFFSECRSPTGVGEPPSHDKHFHAVPQVRRTNGVWAEPARDVQACGGLRRPRPEGRQSWRFAHRTANAFRARDQYQDGQGAWADDPRLAARPCRRGDRMRRRAFMALLAAWPLAARAQQADRLRRVGVLFTLTRDNAEGQARMTAFRQGLEALGWADGRNLRIDDFWAGIDVDGLRRDAAELLSLKPDAIMAGGSRALIALQNATHAIPIVFVAAAGTIEHGIVTNVARPAGNLTGFTTFDDFSLAGKLAGLLKEMAPRLARIALIMHRDHPSLAGYRNALATDAPSLSVQPITIPASNAGQIERAIGTFAREPNGGLLVPPDQFNVLHRDLTLELASRHRLPAIYGYRSHVAAGGLMSYSTDFHDIYRRAAAYVHRILKGEKPANLPVQSPIKYELAISLSTAKALGLDVPATLLARTDEVIE